MKILMFNTLYSPNIVGGAEKCVQELAEILVLKGVDVVVVTTSNREYVDYVNRVKVYYVKVPNLYWFYESKQYSKLKRFIWHLVDQYNFFLGGKIKRIINDERPDIVHTNTLQGLSVIVWDVANRKNLPIVHTLLDYHQLCWKSSMFKGENNCLRQCFDCRILSGIRKSFSSKVDAVIGVSDFVLRRHLDLGYFPKADIKDCIYIAIPGDVIPRERNCNNSKIIFGYAGVLSRIKGVELILKLFSTHLRDQTLFVFGNSSDKNYEQYLKTQFHSGNIFFKGFKPREEIYSNIDVLLVPSFWHEPFGRIIIEANLFGLPVIASRVGGISELVKDSETGFLCDPKHPDTFLEKIRLFVDNPNLLTMMKDGCRANAREFNLDSLGDAYTRIYRRIIEKRINNP